MSYCTRDYQQYSEKCIFVDPFQLDFNREIKDETLKAAREEELKALMKDQIGSGQFREVCWDLEQRGSVGETWY